MLEFDPRAAGLRRGKSLANGRGGRGHRRGHGGSGGLPFTLYIEGPRDRSILRAWAYRLLPAEASRLFSATVILGGRRPARALEHFRGAGGRGLCVLDRDEGAAPDVEPEAGLELFTWSRRHIESYLLVPAAIRRALRLPEGDRRVERALEEHLPEAPDETLWRALDAKRLIAPKGVLARALGRPLPLARIAQATREGELHADVHTLFDRLRLGVGGARR